MKEGISITADGVMERGYVLSAIRAFLNKAQLYQFQKLHTIVLNLIALILIFFLSTPAQARGFPSAHDLFNQVGLSTDELSFWKFQDAYNHFKYNPTKKNIITIIDYGKPSSSQRFWVIDIDRRKLLYATYVSHGTNSGHLYARHFSNKVNSRQTSLGVYLTAEDYHGKFGYSLRLDGLSKGLNDNARRRAIVIHGASYADPEVISKTGQLGRSWGCPALPTHLASNIIEIIKNGTYIYAYS